LGNKVARVSQEFDKELNDIHEVLSDLSVHTSVDKKTAWALASGPLWLLPSRPDQVQGIAPPKQSPFSHNQKRRQSTNQAELPAIVIISL